MCSAVTQPIAKAGKAVGSAFERNVSHPIKYASDEFGRQFEMNVSHPIKYASDELAKGFEKEISQPTKEFFDNRKNWFDKPGIPTPPEPDPAQPSDPMPTFMSPNPSEQSAMRRRKRMNALRMGLLSTVRAGGGLPTAELLAPVATPGAATKLKLGQ